jgi:uncharacterized damage-inducible protein DinB
MAKIELNRLQKIIREELANLHEGADHDSAAKIMSAATKLIKAIDSFKEASSEKAKSELGSSLDSVEQTLSRIVSSPMQYVDATKPPEKKVTLKPQQKSSVV